MNGPVYISIVESVEGLGHFERSVNADIDTHEDIGCTVRGIEFLHIYNPDSYELRRTAYITYDVPDESDDAE
jgi:hypothetical protein